MANEIRKNVEETGVSEVGKDLLMSNVHQCTLDFNHFLWILTFQENYQKNGIFLNCAQLAAISMERNRGKGAP